MLEDHLLLDERIRLLLEEVHLVHVAGLHLIEVLLEVANVLDDLLKDVIGRLCCVVLKRGTFRTQQLNLFLVVV